MIEDREILESLQALREDVARMRALVGRSEARAPDFPHRTRYILLLEDLGWRVLQAHSDWLDHVERELGTNSLGLKNEPA